MRKIALMLGLVYVALFLPQIAHAQTVQIFGGYSYLRPGVMPGFSAHPDLNGWEVAGTYDPLKWIGVTGDISSDYGTANGVSIHLQNYLFGPQVHVHPLGPVSPFAHALIGESQGDVLGTSVPSTAFAVAFGGGIDVNGVAETSRGAPSLSFRPIQIDDLVTQFGSRTQNSLRVSIGLVLNF